MTLEINTDYTKLIYDIEDDKWDSAYRDDQDWKVVQLEFSDYTLIQIYDIFDKSNYKILKYGVPQANENRIISNDFIPTNFIKIILEDEGNIYELEKYILENDINNKDFYLVDNADLIEADVSFKDRKRLMKYIPSIRENFDIEI